MTGPMVATANELASAKEHALRQLEHLRRNIDYGYPPVVIRNERKMANSAVTGYIKAFEAFNRERRSR